MFGNLFNQKRPIDQPSELVSQSSSSSVISSGSPQVVSPLQDVQPVIGSTMKPTTRADLSVLTHLDSRSAVVLHQAEEETKRIQQEHIDPMQLLFGLLYDGEIFQMLGKFSVDTAKLSSEIQAKEHAGTFSGHPTLSDATKKVLEEAYKNAKSRNTDFISPEDMLISVLSL